MMDQESEAEALLAAPKLQEPARASDMAAWLGQTGRTRTVLGSIVVVTCLTSCGQTPDPARTLPPPAPAVDPAPALPPLPTVDFFGLALGEQTDSAAKKIPADAERVKEGDVEAFRWSTSWHARTWTATAMFEKGVLTTTLIGSTRDAPEGRIVGLRAWAKDLCDKFAPGGSRVAMWGGSAKSRFMLKLDDANPSNLNGLGCEYTDSNARRWAVVSGDAAMAVQAVPLPADASPEQKKGLWSVLTQAATPFDWEASPHVGDPIGGDGVEYVVEKVTWGPAVGANPYIRTKAPKGAFFVSVFYTMENKGMSTMLNPVAGLVMRDLSGRTFSPSTRPTLTVAAEEKLDLIVTELQPGVPRPLVAVFEVPDSVRPQLDLVISAPVPVVLPFSFADVKKPPK